MLTEAELQADEDPLGARRINGYDIAAALPKKNALAYNSVLTTIRILEKRGTCSIAKEGRASFYVPLVAEAEAGISAEPWCQPFLGKSEGEADVIPARRQ